MHVQQAVGSAWPPSSIQYMSSPPVAACSVLHGPQLVLHIGHGAGHRCPLARYSVSVYATDNA